MTAEPLDPVRFHTTRWTQVLAARGNSPDAKQALRDLCENYYAPVELFVRRYRGTDDARDLTHEFFARLLEGKSLRNVDRMGGRFRSYLLGAVKHFLADLRDRDNALRRGGGLPLQSLDYSQATTDAANRVVDNVADPRGWPPDEFFDRQWAVAIVERSIDTLRQEAIAAGDVARFEFLKRWLVATDATAANDQLDLLGLSAGALKVAVHRLRKRFRQVIRSIIADTVDAPVDIPDELDYLIRALTASLR